MNVKKKNQIKGKTILITGGTGSFGSTMMKALLELSPKEIIIFSRDELKQFEMRNQFNQSHLRFVIGDVRDKHIVNLVMHGVDYVFHAAALKQVPTAEFFPLEAVKTNILGAHNVIDTAIANNVKKVVILSTDKAVYPINAMGMTKALMEKIMIATARDLIIKKNRKTIVCGVRYGNVMYSRGSVIPFFVNQIKAGQRLSITHPSMTRFLLPLSDSVNLVFHALTAGKNGYLYVKKAQATSIKILAEALSRLFNYSKGVRFVGIRAGEKMHETLISREEWLRVVDQKDFFAIPPETKALEYEKYFAVGTKTREDEEGYTSSNTHQLSIDATAKLLLTLPEIRQELSLL